MAMLILKVALEVRFSLQKSAIGTAELAHPISLPAIYLRKEATVISTELPSHRKKGRKKFSVVD